MSCQHRWLDAQWHVAGSHQPLMHVSPVQSMLHVSLLPYAAQPDLALGKAMSELPCLSDWQHDPTQ